MDNYTIAENFSLLAKLIDIHGDNTFKSRTYGAAAFNIEKLPMQLSDTPRSQLAGIKGIGSGTAEKIAELLDTGQLEVLNDYIARTPTGVIEMLNIKGIGPKKIHTIWKEMEIESIGELLYACNENRLTLYKGFGEKTQQNVQDAIEFYFANQGHFLYAELDTIFPQVDGYLKKLFGNERVHVTGAYRGQALTIEELEFVIAAPAEKIKPAFQTAQPPELLTDEPAQLLYKLKTGLRLRIYCGTTTLAKRLFDTSGSPAFREAFLAAYPGTSDVEANGDDAVIFANAGIDFIPAFLRETADILQQAAAHTLPVVIQPEDVKAVIHSHSNWSDGSNTIEEMAKECIRRGMEYLVISDHSQTAFYANGLKEDRVREQHAYIDQLNANLHPFKVFKSIESDILNDGSLDYPPAVLDQFDLVIASVHSNLKMPEEKAMKRLLTAIENPYTTILGHPTGRLLLSRNGYPLDHKKIIDACAANHVVIELNAHPRRLDIDWKWISYAIEKNVLLSIDPDAHALEGYDDIRFGVLAAQKGGLTSRHNLSSYSLAAFEQFLADNRKQKGR